MTVGGVLVVVEVWESEGYMRVNRFTFGKVKMEGFYPSTEVCRILFTNSLRSPTPLGLEIPET